MNDARQPLSGANRIAERSTTALRKNKRVSSFEMSANACQGVAESHLAAKRMRFCLLPTGPPLAVLRCVVSSSQLHPGLPPGFTVEKTRSYSFGIFGVVTSVPSSATSTTLQEHFAPLRRFLAFMQIAADSPHAFKFRAGYRVWGGRTGISPCLTSTLE